MFDILMNSRTFYMIEGLLVGLLVSYAFENETTSMAFYLFVSLFSLVSIYGIVSMLVGSNSENLPVPIMNILRLVHAYLSQRNADLTHPREFAKLFAELEEEVENFRRTPLDKHARHRVIVKSIRFLKQIGYSAVYFWRVKEAGPEHSNSVEVVQILEQFKSPPIMVKLTHSIELISNPAAYQGMPLLKLHKFYSALLDRLDTMPTGSVIDPYHVRNTFLDFLNIVNSVRDTAFVIWFRMYLKIKFLKDAKDLELIDDWSYGDCETIQVSEVLSNPVLRHQAIVQLVLMVVSNPSLIIRDAIGVTKKDKIIDSLLYLLDHLGIPLTDSEQKMFDLNSLSERPLNPSININDANNMFDKLMETRKIRSLRSGRDVLIIIDYFSEWNLAIKGMLYFAKKKQVHELDEKSVLARVGLLGIPIKVPDMHGRDICLEQDRLLTGIGKMFSGLTSYIIFPFSNNAEYFIANNANQCKRINSQRINKLECCDRENRAIMSEIGLNGDRVVAHVVSRIGADRYDDERYVYVRKLCKLLIDNGCFR